MTLTKRSEILESARDIAQDVFEYRTMRNLHGASACFRPGVADRALFNRLISLECEPDNFSEIDSHLTIGSSAQGLLKHFFYMFGVSTRAQESEGKENEIPSKSVGNLYWKIYCGVRNDKTN